MPCELELNPQNVLWLSLVAADLLGMCLCSMNCTKELHKSSSYFRSVKVNKSELVKLVLKAYGINISATDYCYNRQTNAAGCR